MVQPEIRNFIVSCGLEYYKSGYFYALKGNDTYEKPKRLRQHNKNGRSETT